MIKQRGLTIVELMIALSLGIVLVTGVITLSITVNRSVDLSDGLSRNQENGRFTMDYLTRYIRKAGFSDDSLNDLPPVFVAGGSTRRNAICTVDDACSEDDRSRDPDDGDDISGDKISIPFYASEETTTCTGEIVSGSQTFVNVFWVNSTRQLLCRVFNASTASWHSDRNSTIINGVENLQVQLGMASEPSSRDTARYVSIDRVSSDIDLIRSIRISIMVSSQDPLDDDNNTLHSFTKKYGLLDSTPVSYSDGYVRHVFSNTIDLPNAIYGANEVN